ncbi:MAG: zinc-ribbon domain-containing protein [Bacteroidales bacterium]|nr:zinc-ribbon domain-containing protein [Bacteroidales bacterium]
MVKCNKCGADMAENAVYCPFCGAPQNSQQQNIMDTPDTTSQYTRTDIESNKAMAVLSYLGILVLVPILAAKNSPFARFHANQGLVLCITAILYSIAYTVINAIVLAISWRLMFISTILGLLGIVFTVWVIIGIINAVNGKAKELPIIGKYRILK